MHLYCLTLLYFSDISIRKEDIKNQKLQMGKLKVIVQITELFFHERFP